MQTMQGIIDIHAHADPDRTGRSVDILELVKMYQDRGVRAVVLMNHFDPTAGQAYLAGKHAPNLEVYGGIVLNGLVGGMNPMAVEHFVRMEGGLGKIVYMPTLDSENETRKNGSTEPCVPVSKDGELLPEVLDMLDLITKHKLALSTGHSTPEETLLLTKEAKARGVEQVLATNPLYWAINASVDQMVAAADAGAFIEFIYFSVGRPDAVVTMKDYADAIKAIGPERCILSSCGGQAWMPIHTFAWKELFRGLSDNGLTDHELNLMARINPATLLGLS